MITSVHKQKHFFLGTVKTDQDLLLTSHQMSQHIIKTNKHFTLAKEEIKPVLQSIAEQLLDKETECKLQNITKLVFNIAVSRRFHMTKDLLEHFNIKLQNFHVRECKWMNQLILEVEHNC